MFIVSSDDGSRDEMKLELLGFNESDLLVAFILRKMFSFLKDKINKTTRKQNNEPLIL